MLGRNDHDFFRGGRRSEALAEMDRRALAHPGLTFVLRADDSEVYRLPATSDLLDRIRDLHGEEVTRHLRALQFSNGVVDIGGPSSASER